MSIVDAQSVLAGDRRALAKAITLVESSLPAHRQQAQELLEALLPASGRSVRIGISGVPGVGKSTFIENFGQLLVGAGKRVAVLAIDPSSPLAGGSILGDKTRMETLARHESVFIRPSPTSGALGGVAQKTRESIVLCEAAGYDVILVETVGVGQSEFLVAGMVDFFMLLMLPGGGDELQGIKKGIVELAHAIVINKADGEAAGIAASTQTQYQSALHILKQDAHWQTKVLRCSALEKTGLEEIWDVIQTFVTAGMSKGRFGETRAQQNLEWMHQLVQEMLLERVRANSRIAQQLPNLESSVAGGETTAYAAAQKVLKLMDSDGPAA